MIFIRRGIVRPNSIQALEGRRLMAASLVGTFTNQPAPPTSMASGEFAAASYTVKNVGNSSSSNFLPIFVLEQNTPTPGAGGDVGFAAVTSIGTSDTSNMLAPGQTATETLEFVLPQNLSGTFYIVGEFTLSNFFASAPINVNGLTPSLGASFVQAPSTAAFGSTVAPQLRITNNGTADASGQEVTNYYLSTSNNPNQPLASGISGLYFLGSSTEAINLAAGQNTVESPSLTLPNAPNIPTGTYYLVAQANQGSPPIADPVSNNPVAVSGPIMTTAAPAGVPSQLVPTLTSTKLPASLLSSMATPFTATIAIQNQGTSLATGSSRIILYLSQSPTLDSNAVPVVSVPRTLRIPAHRSVALRIRLGSIPAMTNGAYYLLAQVIDSSGNTNFTASAGTINVAAPFVALAASLPALPSNPVKTGATLTLRNGGNIPENTILNYTLGFSSDPNGIQAVGSTLQTRSAGRIELRPATTVRLHVSGWSKILSNLPAGQYYLTVFAEDATGNTSLAVSPTPVTIG